MPRHAAVILCCLVLFPTLGRADETLYNGIVLPDPWPPRPRDFARGEPQAPPYLTDPPAVIPIDLGRQLFVDDFLIQGTTLRRVFHRPVWHEATPVLQAEHAWENWKDMPFAAPFSDGVWYDPNQKQFRMWYMGGTAAFFCHAVSDDGIRWRRTMLDDGAFKGSNRLDIQPVSRDSSVVWLDHDDPDPAQRFKLMYYRAGLQVRTSADGLHWSDTLAPPGPSGDRSTFFRNPFRNVWVYSIRAGRNGVGRCRYYGESRTFGRPLWRRVDDLSRWACADGGDRTPGQSYEGDLPDLYNLDATPYESLMLGLFTIHPHDARGDRPKINYVTLGYSRDGFHWHRPDRRPFLDVSDDPNAWNYGNVQPAGGGCLVVGDRLYFYCSGRNSRQAADDGAGGATGLAVLRRDGFASMQAGEQPGSLTTRPVRFAGEHLFVNVDCPGGSLRAEVIDDAGQPIAPYTQANSIPVAADSTRAPVRWKGADGVSALAGRAVRIRLHLTNGSLFSFWVSADPGGASNGYVAAGGPGFRNGRDGAAQ
jgi:hypothetical protein